MWPMNIKNNPPDGLPISVAAEALRDQKDAVQSIIEVDHMPVQGDYYGLHKAVQLPGHASDPSPAVEKAMLYSKLVNTYPELYLLDKDGSRKTMLSHRGLVGNARFSAYLSADQAVAAYATVDIQFNTEDYDLYSEFDTTTYRWYPSVSGAIYFLGLRVCVTSVGLKFSVVDIRLVRGGNTYIIGVQGGALLRAQAGDYVYARLSNNDQYTGSISGGSGATRFSATLLYVP